MRVRITLLFLLIVVTLFPALSLRADQVAITDDGKKVRLKDDGTWEYVKDETKIADKTVAEKASDPSVPFGIAEEYKSNYDFEEALEWYDRVIKDFPESLEAGNASLNRLGILKAECTWYLILSGDFRDLYFDQADEADRYSYGGQVRAELMLKADSLNRKRLKCLPL